MAIHSISRARSSVVVQRAALGEKGSTENELGFVNVFFAFAGKTHCLFLDPNTTFWSVKKQLVEHVRATMDPQLRVKPSQLVMIWRGVPLDDENSINSCSGNSDIANKRPSQALTRGGGITIHVSIRQPGGCFMISALVLFLIMIACVGSLCTCGCSLLVIPFLLPLLFVLPLFCL
mmetsp:Transcript_27066/g.56689  ORF Transcript_27066/g.56689 Transcript_27066/m.56689 type:complete len:176 (-) Transcript_27066:1003-1530(-)